MPTLHTTAIFVGSRWLNPAYAEDKVDGLDQFYRGIDQSSYMQAIAEYRFFGNSPKEISLGYSGHIIKAYGFRGTRTAHLDPFTEATSAVCRMAATNELSMGKETDISFFPVYLDRRRPSGEACSTHGFPQFGSTACPSVGSLKHRLFMVAVFYDIDGDSDCDVDDSVTGHSPGLSALANQTARTVADIHTDPFFASYYDSELNEVDDKCAWTFQVPFVTFDDGSQWKLQSLWSNAAYESGTGFPNADGARGCVVGP